ncbi:MAG: DUF1365 domain-containing protein [Pseudomonadales bacterium]|jgi:DUF1365 family protein|nr:DUF1365 domain-containing protein [Pseudomonadales bacterium]
MVTNHALGQGRVWHVREQPFRHAFDYGVHMLLLDLDDLEGAFAGHPFWSLDRANLGSVHGGDYLRDHGVGAVSALAERARDAVQDRLGFRPRSRVRLLAHPRYFGYAFNPVTFHLFGDDGDLEAILLEVANTPWNERHLYALDCRDRSGSLAFELAKDFHVSPFLPMDMRYRFAFRFDGRRFEVTKQNFVEDQRIFTARMALDLEPLTHRALTRALLGFPPMTFRVIGGIYWQALRLWLRGARYHPRPASASVDP